MTEGTFFNTVYVAAQWLARIAYLQFLFMCFFIVGLGIFGIFPASAAMLAVIRQWLMKKNGGENMFRIFYSYFREFFLKVNGLGYFLVLLTFCLSFYVYIFNQVDASWGKIAVYLFLLLFIFLVIMWLYTFPVVVHYKMKWSHVLKNALLIGFLRPFHTVSFFFLIIIFYIWGRYIPGFIPVVSVSLLGAGWMAIALNAFKKIDNQEFTFNQKHDELAK